MYHQSQNAENIASPAIANPPYSKGITPNDAPAAATPIPLASISASPIRLWFRMILIFE
jgi:hypothetical protein